MPERGRVRTERDKERDRIYRQARAADPELLERHRESQRKWRERNPQRPEREVEQTRARARNWYGTLSPERKEEVRARAKEWARRNPEKVKEYSRKSTANRGPEKRRATWIKSKYGLTDEQYAEILAHDGRCDACSIEFSEQVRRHIDHDHARGKGHYRGLLCGPCNQAAGLLRDAPERAELLAAYLRRVTGPDQSGPGSPPRPTGRL